MARPPRGRLPGHDLPSDDGAGDELPLELPRVDPIRSRIQRPIRTEPRIETKVEPTFERAQDETSAIKGPPRFVPPLRAAMPEPEAQPQRLVAERVDNPFDYYAMPKDGNDPISRPIVKSDEPEKPEFLTSKYYVPRSDLTASRDVEVNVDEDQTVNWARSVRPGRPILDSVPPHDDDTPEYLRHLPSRVRDHLRAEPKMPQVSEALGSFVQSAPTATQLRARSGVPLPLAPELRAPVPQSVRVTRQVPFLGMPDVNELPTQEVAQIETYDDTRSLEEQIEDAFRDNAHDNAVDDFPHEPEFDTASDEAVTQFDRDVPPLVEDRTYADMARDAMADYNPVVDPRMSEARMAPSEPVPNAAPSWMRRTEQVQPPPPVSVSDWDQDQAMHALTSRIRNRSVEVASRFNASTSEKLMKTLRGTVDTVRGKLSDVRDAHVSRTMQKRAAKPAPDIVASPLRAPVRSHDIHVQQAAQFVEAPTNFAPDFTNADQHDFGVTRKRWSLFKKRDHAPVVRVSAEANRSQRRKRSSRLYEDIVAWIVVPPFIIGAIYGGLELAKFLSNSPLGKMLSGQ